MAVRPLQIRKLADKSSGDRIKVYDPETGESFLADPAVWRRDDPSTWVPCPWPSAGIQVVDAPKDALIPTSFVDKGLADGWLELENPRMVFRPGGPPEAPWRVTHSFKHADAIVIHAVDGPVRYRVVDNPDKWPAEKNEADEGFGGDVVWAYRVKLDKS